MEQPAQPQTDHPRGPMALKRRSWWGVLKRTITEFREDNLTDWAAALTYYGVLSLFPGLLVLVSLLGLFGQSSQPLIDSLTELAPGEVGQIIGDVVANLQANQQGAGLAAIFGIAVALWSASGYVGAFMRAANSVYDVPEGRPIWKKLPTRLAITIAAGLLVAVAAFMLVVTGPIARWLGDLIGLGEVAVTVWDIAKWPLLLLIVALILAVLYRGAPNVRHSGFRWVSPGALLAVIIWVIASAGFALYVANFGSYNKTYGVLAGAIVFLVWLWLTNIAVLLGAEFDAELERGRAIERGHPEDEEPFIRLRSTDKAPPDALEPNQPRGAERRWNGEPSQEPDAATRETESARDARSQRRR